MGFGGRIGKPNKTNIQSNSFGQIQEDNSANNMTNTNNINNTTEKKWV